MRNIEREEHVKAQRELQILLGRAKFYEHLTLRQLKEMYWRPATKRKGLITLNETEEFTWYFSDEQSEIAEKLFNEFLEKIEQLSKCEIKTALDGTKYAMSLGACGGGKAC